MITKEEYQLVFDCLVGNRPNTDLKDYFSNSLDLEKYRKLINECIELKNNGQLEVISYLSLAIDDKKGVKEIDNQLLLENWHYLHEEILSGLQHSGNFPECIPNIIKIMEEPPIFYTKGGQLEGFIRKCTYVIAAQSEPYNIEALTKLSQNTDEFIKKFALHQLGKIADRKML
jgi:hypothetical protein